MSFPTGEPERPVPTPPDPDRAATTPTRRVWRWSAVAVGGAVGLTLILAARHRLPPSSSQSPPAAPASSPSASALPDFEVRPVSVEEGRARWYDVPEKSLAQRRAWPGEFTAASDRLPKNVYVRVRRIDPKADPDKTVVVRITDDGIHDPGTIIDLDRDAAEALGMVRAGQARVRLEVLALKNATADKPVEKKTDPPIAPKASALTDQPTADQQQEKDAARAKSSGSASP